MPQLNLFSRSRVFGNIALSVAALGATACLPFSVASAQQPLLLAMTRVPVHHVAAQGAPEAAEAPQSGGANTPALKDDLFAGTEKFAKGATDATEVNMDPDSLNMVGGPEADRAHRTVLNIVHTYTYDKPGMYNPADVEEYRRKLEGGDWHCSIHTRDLKTGESTDICNRRRAPDLLETAIITVAPKELTFIHTIRKANGQGGSLEGEGLGGISEAMPLAGSRLVVPKIQDDLLASRAGLMAATGRARGLILLQ